MSKGKKTTPDPASPKTTVPESLIAESDEAAGTPAASPDKAMLAGKLQTLRETVERAENVVPLNPDPAIDGDHADPLDGSDDGGRGERPTNEYGLPDGCPVIPLGKHGQDYYYLDALRQVIVLKPRDHSRNAIAGLFAPQSHLLELFWPRVKELPIKDKAGKVMKDDVGNTLKEWCIVGFKAEDCADALMDACARKGVWTSFDKLRGQGAWLSRDGSLIFHCGDVLWMNGEAQLPGEVDGCIYPAAPAIPGPADDPAPPASQGGPGQELLDMLETWNWERGKVDAMLLLGWFGAAMLSGALEWRPMAFITGDKASGKSTIHKVIKYLFDGGIIQTANTSAAGIYQHVGHSSMPIAIDELEADADNRKSTAVIQLARLAASGAVMLRGGAEHKGVEFQARSCFLFSAILMPPLKAQDRSRMAILRLGTLESAKPPSIEPGHLSELGRQLRRRLVDQWPRFSDTIFAYQAMLVRAGHDGRGSEQFGTLLACADVMLHNHEPDSDTLAYWEKALDASTLRELIDTKSNAESCLDWLCQSEPEAWRGGSRYTVGEIVREVRVDQSDTFHVTALTTGGMAVCKRKEVTPDGCSKYVQYLAVGSAHRGTMRIFEGSEWSGEPGVPGGWTEALGRLPGAITGEVAKIGGRATRCVKVPVELVAPIERLDQSADQADTALSTDTPEEI